MPRTNGGTICPECGEELGNNSRRIYKHAIQEFNLEDQGAKQIIANAEVNPGPRADRIIALMEASLAGEA